MKQSADGLVRLMKTLADAERDEQARKERLEREPQGFFMPGNRNCSLCGQVVREANGWYDKWGFKCMNCQDAVNKKKIPGSLCGDYDHTKYITDADLSHLAGVRIAAHSELVTLYTINELLEVYWLDGHAFQLRTDWWLQDIDSALIAPTQVALLSFLKSIIRNERSAEIGVPPVAIDC